MRFRILDGENQKYQYHSCHRKVYLLEWGEERIDVIKFGSNRPPNRQTEHVLLNTLEGG
jgi:hypothetical protein